MAEVLKQMEDVPGDYPGGYDSADNGPHPDVV